MPCPRSRVFLLCRQGRHEYHHAEPGDAFPSRYGIAAVPAAAARRFRSRAARLDSRVGITTFVGSPGAFSPADMKAVPLLRAWLHRLAVIRGRLPQPPPLAG